MIKDGLWDAFNNYHMGTTAENINDIWGITRREQDEFAAASQQKACAARDSGRFDDEIVPVPVKVKKEIVEFKRDEYPKENVTADSIAKLRGAFPVGPESPNPQVVNTFEPTGIQDAEDKGTPRVTAANASGINDGAAAIVLASGEAVEKYGLKPMAKLIGWGQGGVDPKIMGVGPVVASRAAMAKAGVTIDDIDLVEANEAFAAQSIAVARELHFDMSKVNVNGGAIALGHPVGASGARIIVTLIHEMMKRPRTPRRVWPPSASAAAWVPLSWWRRSKLHSASPTGAAQSGPGFLRCSASFLLHDLHSFAIIRNHYYKEEVSEHEAAAQHPSAAAGFGRGPGPPGPSHCGADLPERPGAGCPCQPRDCLSKPEPAVRQPRDLSGGHVQQRPL